MPSPQDFKINFTILLKTIKDAKPEDQEKIVKKILAEANAEFHIDTTEKKFEVAYKYYAVAEYASINDINVSGVDAAHLYHYAGHHFRFVENWNTAAELYLKAGKYSLKKKDLESIKWAIRSFARAKVCHQDAGDSDEASIAYHKEQEARRMKYKLEKNYGKFIWFGVRKWFTNYGESVSHWFLWFLAIIIFFSITYSFLEWQIKWPRIFDWHFSSFVENGYLYIATTLGFGEIIEKVPWQAKIVIFLNLVSGYFMLALGIDIIIRKFKQS